MTSCAVDFCPYTDLNVAPGTSYDYFVSTFDEPRRRGAVAAALTVACPRRRAGDAGPPGAVALDGAVFLRGRARGWRAVPGAPGAHRQRLECSTFDSARATGAATSTPRADERRAATVPLAAVDELGRVSALGPLTSAIPRPDYHAELLYALADSAAASGFRFVASETDDPIVSGGRRRGAAAAGGVGGDLQPGAAGRDDDHSGGSPPRWPAGRAARRARGECVAIEPARATRTPLALGRARARRRRATPTCCGYGAPTAQEPLRQGPGIAGGPRTTAGRDLVVFDWAYQLMPDEPSLNRV